MKMRAGTVIAVCAISLAVLGPAYTQSARPAPTASDEKARRLLVDERKGGAIIDAVINGLNCSGVNISVAASVDGKVAGGTFPASNTFFGNPTFSGDLAMLPGTYMVIALSCQASGGRTLLRGPFARFQVRAGELVNVGLLRVDFKLDPASCGLGFAHRRIENLRPESVALLKERLPRTMPSVVRRPMTLIGPPWRWARTGSA
jgi:hypothetical protein